MSSLSRIESKQEARPLPLGLAARALLCELASAQLPASGSYLRLEHDVEHLDVFRVLAGMPLGDRRYFRTRTGALEVAGIGRAACAQPTTWTQVGGRTEAVVFTAAPFDPHRPRDKVWDPFMQQISVLPMLELRRTEQGDRVRNTLAVHVVDRNAAQESLALLADEAKMRCSVDPAFTRMPEDVGEGAWTRAVRASLEQIRDGKLRKIVLGRTARYIASAEIDPMLVLHRLAQTEPRSFRCFIEPQAGRAFVGVSPERLYSRVGRSLKSEAVAGTRPRGVDAVADQLMGEALLSSAKDRREHQFVVERIREALEPLSATMRLDDEPRLLRLAYVQHLRTRLAVELHEGLSDDDLLAALHPTPAVSGSPVRAAVEAIRALESFDRGLFAGPLGVRTPHAAEFAVGIRSALIDGDALTAFAGAGIVEGSDAGDEWRETAHKLLAFERLSRQS
ncbi:MAG: isochorismate synthase [Phycisphaerales bacterium]|nr:isochorismate synthase [Phycisphaerales bacterium]